VRHNKYFDKAKEASLKSTFKFKVGACLVIGKTIFTGWNKGEETDPKALSKFNSIHAELDAITKAGFYRDFSNATLYVYRSMRNPMFGKAGMAKPCVHCESLIRRVGIKECFYSIDDYSFGHWKDGHITDPRRYK
jgi:deoxycytidylate deaminase